MSSQEFVTLNVGGKILTTRFSTIKQFPASRLSRMLDGRDEEFKMEGGQSFVDRDDFLFTFILDFLRNHHFYYPWTFQTFQTTLGFRERRVSMNLILWLDC